MRENFPKMSAIKLGVYIIILICVIGTTNGNEDHSRTKREVRQCADKFKVLKTHTACKPRSSAVNTANSGVDQSDIQLILQEHNRYRSGVTPTASNMAKLNWDAEVAEIAQALAETCIFGHDENKDRDIPGRFAVGQNIGKGYANWTAVIYGWYDENKAFTYNSDSNKFGSVGHYTQLVWATTSVVGCGKADCGPNLIHVCNYAPGGNLNGFKQPYKTGASCAECGNHCDGNLCDCGYCENGGQMDLSTCSCTCSYPGFQVDTTCKLDCSNVTEPYQCKDSSYVGDCKGAYNVPMECPKTCNVCPYGAFNYKSDGGELFGNGGGCTLQINLIAICIIVCVHVGNLLGFQK